MSEKIIKKYGRSKKYSANFAKLQKAVEENGNEVLPIDKAVTTIFSFDQASFKNGATIEIHFKTAINPTKSDQLVRGSVVLPHGTGKDIKIAAFVSPENVDKAKKLGAYKAGSDDLIDEIKNGGKVDFDIAIAQPEMMKKMPAIARILGTAGVMPNPKTGTVGDNLEEMINLIKAGKVDFKNDKGANIHFAVGKINKEFNETKVTENILAAIDAVEKAKPSVIKKYITGIYLASTMSPSVKVR